MNVPRAIQSKEDLDHAETWAEIVRFLPAWTWETDAGYRLTAVHTKFTRFSGIDLRDFLGHCILDVTDSGRNAAYLDALKRKQVIECQCYARRLMNGEPTVLMDSAVPKHDKSGRFIGYCGISISLTEILQRSGDSYELVTALQEQIDKLAPGVNHNIGQLDLRNNLLTEVLNAMDEGLMVTSGTDANDPNNLIEIVNPAYRRLFDLTEDDVFPGQRVKDYLEFLMRREGSQETKADIDRVNQKLSKGEQVLMKIPSLDRHYYVRSSKHPSGGYVLVHTDVTELQRNNAELAKARDAAEVANAAKSTFLATMSHEIRTPMNGIVGMSDLLAEMDLTSEQAECVDVIRSAALALTGLISDILDFSKIEAGQMEIKKEVVDLRLLLNDVRDVLRPLIKDKVISLSLRISENTPNLVRGDSLRLRQILLNLGGNAAKFTENGEITLSVNAEDGVCFSVRDTGIGIPQDQLATVFEPFEQVDGGMQREHGGTGLGLAITKTMVAAMGGQLTVQSTLGQGSEFSVNLPLPEVDLMPFEIDQTNVKAEDLSGFEILLVEDNRTNQLVATKQLQKSGASVHLAENGQVALDQFAPEKFDVILMDISMPVMTGLVAATKIREREAKHGWNTVPIIALTGNAFSKDRADALAVGMDGFVTKPVKRDDLVRTILGIVPRNRRPAGVGRR